MKKVLILMGAFALILVGSMGAEEISGDVEGSVSKETRPVDNVTESVDNPPVQEQGDYLIGVNDVLSISVYPDESFSGEATVGYDGKVGIPGVGEFRAEGKSTAELAEAIAYVLKKYIRNPRVVVSVKEYRSRRVLLFGQVGNPGTIFLRPSTRLLEILTLAGFSEDDADLQGISVIHSNGEKTTYDLTRMIERGDLSQNPVLRPDDTIYVPKKESGSVENVTGDFAAAPGGGSGGETSDQAPVRAFIWMFGEVNKPGKIEYDPDEELMTVKKALTLAKWYTEKANLEKAKVIRANNIQEPVNLNRLIFQGDMSQDLLLYPGDSLFVPESKKMGIYVLGFVRNPGFHRGFKGMTVLQALALAGKERFGALIKDTKIVRGWPNRPKVYTVDLERLLRRGEVSQNMTLKDGDVVYVPQTAFSATLEFWNRLLGPITGGLTAAARTEVLSQPGPPPVTSF